MREMCVVLLACEGESGERGESQGSEERGEVECVSDVRTGWFATWWA